MMNRALFLKYAFGFITEVVDFFVASNEKSCTDSKSDNAAGGGTFNFRTESFDDGTDAFGWYEDD